jgi:hypothetical protein
MNIIGISGLARSGKDLFTSVAIDILKTDHNIKSEKFALAYELKLDLYPLVMTKMSIDTFTEDTKSKTVIRPLLVTYGDIMRKTSEGKYWTQKVEKRIATSKADVIFVTDIRYDLYPEDECNWVQRKMMGKLIHITKYQMTAPPSGRRISSKKPIKIYDIAPNEHELFNNPKVKKRADYAFEWQDVSNKLTAHEDLMQFDYIRDIVRKALVSIGQISAQL